MEQEASALYGYQKAQRAIVLQIANGHGGLAKFTENLRGSPFNLDLPNETPFIQIHNDGQYLWCNKERVSILIDILYTVRY